MTPVYRRAFLNEVGQGMLALVLGPTLAEEMGLAREPDGSDKVKTTAKLERLRELLRQTPSHQLLPALVGELERGTDLRELTAAAALANATAFGGEEYDAYHTFMALAPAYAMSRELPEKERPLPVFKVLYRNSACLEGYRERQPLPLRAAHPLRQDEAAAQLLTTVRQRDKLKSDGLAIALSAQPFAQSFDDLQPTVQDELNVHRVVLAWRCWEILDFTGAEYAQLMLRQTVRHCATSDQHTVGQAVAGLRDQLGQQLEKYGLLRKEAGERKGGDAWLERTSTLICTGKRGEAVEAVAEALGDGIAPEEVGEALSLAATRLLLYTRARKVHGDSIGVHACDAANAWRNIARLSPARTRFASLLSAAAHTAGQYPQSVKSPFVSAEDVAAVKTTEPAKLLSELDEALRAQEQKWAAALTQRYGELGHPAEPVFALLRRYAISEDGKMHAEKYYRTVIEEFGRTRASFRWRHLTALARVTASACGTPAAGIHEARRLLKL